MDIANYGESNSAKKSAAGMKSDPEMADNTGGAAVDRKEIADSADRREQSDTSRNPARLAAELVDVGKQWARQCGVDAREFSDEYVQMGIGYVQRRPVRAVLIGIGVGAALTMWLSRRRASTS